MATQNNQKTLISYDKPILLPPVPKAMLKSTPKPKKADKPQEDFRRFGAYSFNVKILKMKTVFNCPCGAQMIVETEGEFVCRCGREYEGNFVITKAIQKIRVIKNRRSK